MPMGIFFEIKKGILILFIEQKYKFGNKNQEKFDCK